VEILSDRPVPQLPTSDAGPRCGKWLFIIAKVQAGLPLSITERDFVADVLRENLLSRKHWRAYKRWKELRHYEQVRKMAPYAVPYGQYQEWVQGVLGKSKAALMRFVARRRAP
jgi:hypothetical protein